jgi:hypothetical protein
VLAKTSSHLLDWIVYPPFCCQATARQTRSRGKELFEVYFYMLSMMYQRKVGAYLLSIFHIYFAFGAYVRASILWSTSLW